MWRDRLITIRFRFLSADRWRVRTLRRARPAGGAPGVLPILARETSRGWWRSEPFGRLGGGMAMLLRACGGGVLRPNFAWRGVRRQEAGA